MTKFIVNNRTGALKIDINLFFTIKNCRIFPSRSLTRRTNFKFMCLSAYWPQKLTNERAWISAVIVKTRVLTNQRACILRTVSKQRYCTVICTVKNLFGGQDGARTQNNHILPVSLINSLQQQQQLQYFIHSSWKMNLSLGVLVYRFLFFFANIWAGRIGYSHACNLSTFWWRAVE